MLLVTTSLREIFSNILINEIRKGPFEWSTFLTIYKNDFRTCVVSLDRACQDLKLYLRGVAL